MANDGTINWHRDPPQAVTETTVRHPGPLEETLLAWAVQEDISDVFAAVALTFGFSEAFTIIGNLSQELSHPEASDILNEWSDDPIVNELLRLNTAYRDSPTIVTQYPPYPHHGNVKQTASQLRKDGANIAQSHFLLHLIVTPLAAERAYSPTIYKLRRSLRLWLIVQALKRTVAHRYCHDSQIQRAASFITQNVHDKNWGVIDNLLDRCYQILGNKISTLSQFSLALEHAALQLKVHDSNRGAQRFLNAVVAIAQGECAPIETASGTVEIKHAFKRLRTEESLPPTLMYEGIAFQNLEIPLEQQETDDDPEQALLFEVDPEESPERQRLTGQSILLQSAELSHYLPWSWDKALPPEMTALEQWLEQGLASSNLLARLGSAIAWLATRFSRSLPYVLEFSISETPEPEWSVSPDFRWAHRVAPTRHGAWYPGEEALPWINPFENELSLDLPFKVQEAFKSVHKNAGTHCTVIHDLWYSVTDQNPEVWFNEQTRKHFPRLSSAKLANVLPQQVFNLTSDHSLSRLISAHPRSALPAACGYSNWDIHAVESGFQLPIRNKEEHAGIRLNLLGSLLDPLESALLNSIGQATKKLHKSRTHDNLITYHNTLARYVVTALYAATGSRYLTDPFESLGVFCTSLPAVFINDKTDSGLHNGRLVPLPDRAVDILSAYRAHLDQLANTVENVRPDLAENLKSLLSDNTAKLPLFFLFDEQLKWHSISESGLPGDDLFEWPLPSNLFRHRFAQQLAREGVNTEVIDGWMGHAERGAATYGDTSARCWMDDFSCYQDVVNRSFDRLGFDVPVTDLPPLPISPPKEDDSSYTEPSIFGYRKRARNRRTALQNAIRSAREDLDLFVGEQSVDDLTPEQIDRMAKLMLLKQNGLPHPQAAIRFSVMTKLLDASKNEHKRLVRRRMAKFESERSLLSQRCTSALTLIPALDQWATQTKQSIQKSKISKTEALAVAAALLAINKRLSYRRLLHDIMQGQNYRLIQHRKQIFFEYNEHLDPEDHWMPVQRHEVDYKTASLLNHGLAVKTSVDTQRVACPKHLQSLAELLQGNADYRRKESSNKTLGWVITELSELINQANLIQLPGPVAAALSERCPPTSLGLSDYLRLKEGVIYCIPDPQKDTDWLDNLKSVSVPYWDESSIDSRALQHNAKSFFKGLESILGDYTGTTKSAREIADRIDRYNKEQSVQVSTSILLVGYWLADRIRKGKGKPHTNHSPYATSSPRSYLSRLSQPFQGLAYDVDLTTQDQDSITDLCARMLLLKSRTSSDLTYFSARLQEFFRWAGRHGIEEPYWDELDLGDAHRSVKPGVFTESEYQQCLKRILNSVFPDQDAPLLTGFVFLLAYRFGLRAQEALGLKRQDWCESGGLRWILVRNNNHRALKSPHSRRAIPLMFTLTEGENQLIDSVLARYDSLVGKRTNAPLLCDIVEEDVDITPLRDAVPSMIARVLKGVTGNARISLHHARHSFYNVLTPVLLGFETDSSKVLATNLEPEQLRHLILGENHSVSRRSAMALARAMGHYSPTTGLRSYNHLLTEWADHLTPVSSERIRRLSNAIQVDGWDVADPQEPAGREPLMETQPLTPTSIVRFMRLLALGRSYDEAERQLQLMPGNLYRLRALIEETNERMRFKVHSAATGKQAWVYGDERSRFLLIRVGDTAWVRLMECVERFPTLDSIEMELPPLDEVPYLVGRNGHLLMDRPMHCNLVQLVLELFQVSSNQYDVIARHDNLKAKRLLERKGFVVSPERDPDTGAKRQLDTYSTGIFDSGYRGFKYGGIIFRQTPFGTLHNQHELAIALLIVAAAYCKN